MIREVMQAEATSDRRRNNWKAVIDGPPERAGTTRRHTGKRGNTGMNASRHRRRLLLALAGNPGAHSGALLSLAAVLMAAGTPIPLFIEIILVAQVLRLLLGLEHRSRPVLEIPQVRKYFRQLVGPEVKFSVMVLAATYLLNWPLVRTVVPIYLISNLAVQMGLFGIGRLILRRLAAVPPLGCRPEAHNRVLIVGTGQRAKAVADLILSSPELDASIDGFLDFSRKGFWRYRDIPLLGHPDLLTGLAGRTQIDAVVLAVEPEEMPQTAPVLAAAERLGVTVSLMPDLYRTSIARAVPSSLNGTPTVAYRRVPESLAALGLKHFVDKVGAVVGLILASPIMIAAAAAIKLETPGPIFFKQMRSGANGRPFPLYKFRTMTADAERHKDSLKNLNEMSGPVFKIKQDPRVTRVGRLLRKYSIDEIPQFINVLRGEMSLVGPRPPLPSEVARYEPWQRRKLSVKPGLTCIWQVSGRNQIDFEDWMRLDLEYIDNWSLWLDARILAKTIPTVLKGDGAS